MRIVFLDRATFSPEVTFDSAPLDVSEWREYPVTSPKEVVERAQHATVLIVNKVRLSRDVLSALPNLRMIAISATGVDNVDLAAARDANIAVANVRGYATHAVPEYVFTMLLALRRNLISYHDAVQAGEWAQSPVYCLHGRPIVDVAGSTLGIIGRGSLGRSVEAMASTFGMSVLIAERKGSSKIRAGRTAFEDVLKVSDAITLHVPLTDDTHKLISADELSLMKPTAILINASRGSVVDEKALLAALKDGRLAGAALDVLGTEPPAANHPLVKANLPNLIVTPHVAWASLQAQQRLADEVILNIAAFQRGEPRNRVD